MRIVIECKTFKLTADVREYMEKKINGLSRFFGPRVDDEVTSVAIDRQRHHRHGEVYEVKVNCPVRGKVLYVTGSGETVFQAIDMVESALKREIEGYRQKKHSLIMRRLRKLKAFTRSVLSRPKEE